MEEYQRLLDAMMAAGFSSRELGIIAESSMGTALDGVTQAKEPTEQAIALVQFAEHYGLLPSLRRAVLYTGADRPGLQNLLLGNNMESSGGKQIDNAIYERLLVQQKLDQLLTESQRNGQQLALVVQQQAQLAQQQQVFDRRLTVVENTAPKPITMSDRILFFMFAAVVIALFSYNFLGRLP